VGREFEIVESRRQAGSRWRTPYPRRSSPQWAPRIADGNVHGSELVRQRCPNGRAANASLSVTPRTVPLARLALILKVSVSKSSSLRFGLVPERRASPLAAGVFASPEAFGVRRDAQLRDGVRDVTSARAQVDPEGWTAFAPLTPDD
jgi:hypothetical protein